jgi:hypothetical protein
MKLGIYNLQKGLKKMLLGLKYNPLKFSWYAPDFKNEDEKL